jgi:hypothetical protein
MLITFKSDAWASFTMFGEVAETLLKMMGHSGKVPGAILAEDIPAALARLEGELAARGAEPVRGESEEPEDEEEEKRPPVTLRLRAYPLIQMLSAAAKEGKDVIWEEGGTFL